MSLKPTPLPQRDYPNWSYWMIGAFVAFAQGIPLYLVRFPPVTDLSQHLAQTISFIAALEGSETFTFSPIAPQGFVYWLLAALSWRAPPMIAGRLALWLVLAATALLVTLWTKREKHSPAIIFFAALPIGGSALRWGLLPFLAGFPIFLAYWYFYTKDKAFHWLALTTLGLLLYSAHLLWFAFACLAVVVQGVRTPAHTWRRQLPYALTLVPAGLLALVYYPSMHQEWSGGGVPLWRHYARWWWRFDVRINAKYLGFGTFETVAILLTSALVTYVLIGLWQWWTSRAESNKISDLSTPALVALACYLLLPESFTYIIVFASRWSAPLMILALLALPSPRSRLFLLLTGLLFFVCIENRTLRWTQFEQREMSGLEESLEALPPHSQVLGLDFVQRSFLSGRPFLQTTAYTEVLKQAQTNFSFTEHPSSYIQEKEPQASLYTKGLEWHARLVTQRDVAHSEYVLVNGLPATQALFARSFDVERVSDHGKWQLYRTGLIRPFSIFTNAAPFDPPERESRPKEPGRRYRRKKRRKKSLQCRVRSE